MKYFVFNDISSICGFYNWYKRTSIIVFYLFCMSGFFLYDPLIHPYSKIGGHNLNNHMNFYCYDIITDDAYNFQLCGIVSRIFDIYVFSKN
jgi:hypothetical protein